MKKKSASARASVMRKVQPLPEVAVEQEWCVRRVLFCNLVAMPGQATAQPTSSYIDASNGSFELSVRPDGDVVITSKADPGARAIVPKSNVRQYLEVETRHGVN